MRAGNRIAAVVFLISTLDARAGESERGATLRIRWRGAEQGVERISLLPVDVALPPDLPRKRAIALWTRPVAGTEQTWTTLPAGTYEIVLRRPVPRDVGEIVLGPGEERTIELTLPPAETPPSVLPLRVIVAASGDIVRHASALVAGNGVLRNAALLPEGGEDGTVLTIAGGCLPGGTFVLASQSHVATLPLDGVCAGTAALRLEPRATLTAGFTVPAGVQAPRFGSVRLADCASAVSAVPFAIADGRAAAAVPAGCRVTSLHIDDFAPVPLPVKALAAGQAHHAGTLALRSGAAAVVRVRSASDARPLSGIRIAAVAAGDLTAMRDHLDDDALAIATAVTDAAGWARLAGLPDEKFVLVLRHPTRRHAQISEPYRLEAGEEAVLEDIALEPSSNLYVMLSLAEGLEQALQVRRVELLPEGHNHWPARVPLTGVLTSTGAVVEDVPAGTWKVRALGRMKSGFSTDLATASVKVGAGVDAFVTLTVTDRIYRGRVTRDGTAVTGTINLKSVERGGGGRHAVATLAQDGSFDVLLDRAGDYTVTVQERSGTMTKVNRYFAFENPENEVAIELPYGRIEGRVVDAAGSPVGGAGVSAAEQRIPRSGSQRKRPHRQRQ